MIYIIWYYVFHNRYVLELFYNELKIKEGLIDIGPRLISIILLRKPINLVITLSHLISSLSQFKNRALSYNKIA